MRRSSPGAGVDQPATPLPAQAPAATRHPAAPPAVAAAGAAGGSTVLTWPPQLPQEPARPRRLVHPTPDDRPSALGYLRVWLHDAPDLAARRAELLGRFAASMGWTLGEV